ncbi:hypothetical protein Cflav_PD6238 [Pedosphaera parvula Ellin514]|uniref:Uncharacterized protein n=1 Tax=Pedosphaera parvula (strain Ellin514) TaxID=320771 RepID=B9XHR9_PEDPL|nr:hypothetical protein Cflav_PD6238 [Pedosphaera parvula Ellin514]
MGKQPVMAIRAIMPNQPCAARRSHPLPLRMGEGGVREDALGIRAASGDSHAPQPMRRPIARSISDIHFEKCYKQLKTRNPKRNHQRNPAHPSLFLPILYSPYLEFPGRILVFSRRQRLRFHRFIAHRHFAAKDILCIECHRPLDFQLPALRQ